MNYFIQNYPKLTNIPIHWEKNNNKIILLVFNELNLFISPFLLTGPVKIVVNFCGIFVNYFVWIYRFPVYIKNICK